MINRTLQKKALEIMSAQLGTPVTKSNADKTYRQLGANEVEELELHYTLADLLNYEVPRNDEELRALNTPRQTLAHILLNAPRQNYK